jgi:hypothetical protein
MLQFGHDNSELFFKPLRNQAAMAAHIARALRYSPKGLDHMDN